MRFAILDAEDKILLEFRIPLDAAGKIINEPIKMLKSETIQPAKSNIIQPEEVLEQKIERWAQMNASKAVRNFIQNVKGEFSVNDVLEAYGITPDIGQPEYSIFRGRFYSPLYNLERDGTLEIVRVEVAEKGKGKRNIYRVRQEKSIEEPLKPFHREDTRNISQEVRNAIENIQGEFTAKDIHKALGIEKNLPEYNNLKDRVKSALWALKKDRSILVIRKEVTSNVGARRHFYVVNKQIEPIKENPSEVLTETPQVKIVEPVNRAEIAPLDMTKETLLEYLKLNTLETIRRYLNYKPGKTFTIQDLAREMGLSANVPDWERILHNIGSSVATCTKEGIVERIGSEVSGLSKYALYKVKGEVQSI